MFYTQLYHCLYFLNYLTTVKPIWTKTRALCIRNYDTQLFQNNSYFELLVKQLRQSECNSNIMVYPLKFDFNIFYRPKSCQYHQI
jgi:hypothetical protein